MYFFSSLAEVVGYISCHLNDKFSRKKVMIGFLGTAGLVCLAVAVIPKDNASGGVTWDSALIILFASFGKAAASAAFNSGYVLTSKLYPTNVRSTLASLVLSK
jgi:MFS family permease